MFERYTEKARRVVFMARYEANQFAASQIEAEYILLGLLREDKKLILKYSHQSDVDLESIRKEIEGRVVRRGSIRELIDIPLSGEAKHALAYAAEESERLGVRHVAPEHLLLGLLRAEDSFAATILHGLGLRIADLRQAFTKEPAVTRHITQKFSVAESVPADLDEQWLRAITDAGIDRGLFTRENLISECVQIAALRGLPLETEALLRLLAAKGFADPWRLSALAVELRDEKGLKDFLERLQ